jgi:hypothetical protein
MKKLLSAILVIFFIFSSFSEVLSDNEDISFIDSEIAMPTGGFLPDEVSELETLKQPDIFKRFPLSSKTGQSMYDYLEEKLRAKERVIEIYSKEKMGAAAFHKILRTVLFNNYDIMVYDEVSGTEVTEGGRTYIYSFHPEYFTPEEGEEAALTMMKREISKYLDAASQIPDDDVIGKMVVIHDLFCKNNRYAVDEYNDEVNNGNIHNEVRTAYWLFKYNKAVCQGNVIALKAIYDELNKQLKQAMNTNDDIIETSFCSSSKLAHIWNVVKVGGKWYHLDETWDDPSSVDTGYARHEYFLRSDDKMSNHIKQGVYDWIYYADEEVTCNDGKYEGEYIFNSVDGRYIELGQMITYEGGRYRLEIEYLGGEYPFWSNSLKATKVLATDPYDGETDGVKCKVIKFFSMDNVDMTEYCVRKRTNGTVAWLSKMSIEKKNVFINLNYEVAEVPRRVLVWSLGGIEPLCRAIDIPADVQ